MRRGEDDGVVGWWRGKAGGKENDSETKRYNPRQSGMLLRNKGLGGETNRETWRNRGEMFQEGETVQRGVLSAEWNQYAKNAKGEVRRKKT